MTSYPGAAARMIAGLSSPSSCWLVVLTPSTVVLATDGVVQIFARSCSCRRHPLATTTLAAWAHRRSRSRCSTARESLLDRSDRAVLGITGPPGSGKSTLTSALLSALGSRLGADAVGHLPMDGFHLADVQLDRLGLRDRKGAPETFDVDGYVAALARLHSSPDVRPLRPGLRARPRAADRRGHRDPAVGAAGRHRGQLPPAARRRVAARTPPAGRGVVRRGRRRRTPLSGWCVGTRSSGSRPTPLGPGWTRSTSRTPASSPRRARQPTSS